MPDKILNVSTDAITESPFNRRRHYGDLEAFGAELARHGVLQPLVARQRADGGYELSLGHRRLRAAVLAGIDKVPVIVREQTDEEVIEAQVAENLEREDVHPMDEAESFELLRDRGHGIEDIAARFGRGPDYVRVRLQLTALSPDVRKMFETGDFDVERAYLIARVPDAKVQKKIAEQIAFGFRNGYYPRDLRQCRELVERYAMRTLRGAPFPTGDPELVPEAGSCTTCPKNTEANAELFDDFEVKSGQCLDGKCFEKKAKAQYKRKAAAAKKAGLTVLKVAESKDLFIGKSLVHGSGYVTASAKPPGSRASYKKLLGEHMPQPVLARDETGAARELYKTADIKAAAKKAKIKLTESGAAKGKAAKASPKAFDPDAYMPRQDRETKLLDQVRDELGDRLAHIDGTGQVRALTFGIAAMDPWAASDVAKRRKLVSGITGATLPKPLVGLIADATLKDLVALALEMTLASDATHDGWWARPGETSSTQRFLELLGVDVAGELAKLRDKDIAEAGEKGLTIKGEEPPAKAKKAGKKKAKEKGGAK